MSLPLQQLTSPSALQSVTLLQESQRLEFVLAATGLGLWELDLDTQQATRSLRHDQCFGYPEGLAEWSFGRFLEHVSPEDREHVQQAFQEATREGKDWCFECRILWPDGSVHWIEARSKHIFDEAGNATHLVGTVGDVSEKKRAEEARRESEKLALAGRLAATLAHEVNNPLESVTNLIYLAKMGSNSPKTDKYLQLAESEVQRAAQITRMTLGFYRDRAAPKLFDPRELSENIMEMLGTKILNKQIEIRREYAESVSILGFEGEIRQGLANLLANAIDASDAGSCIRVRIRAARHTKTGQPGVRISIVDNGSGIGFQQRGRLFEPFHTTKGEIGTGLGLWVTRGIIEKHGGSIRLRSRTDALRRGTTFSVFLPQQHEELSRSL